MIKIGRRGWEIVIFSLLFVVLVILFFKYRYLFDDKQQIRLFLQGFGILAPLGLIVLQMIQVIIPFIPGGIITLSSGFVFGAYLGTIYSVLGMIIGSFIVFSISRKLGRPFVEKVISKKELMHIDLFIKKHGESALFLSRIMPFFPHDIISYAIGLTAITKRKFILASTFGFLPHAFVHNYVGDSFYKGQFELMFYLLITLVILIGIAYLFRHELKKFIFKEFRLFKKGIRYI